MRRRASILRAPSLGQCRFYGIQLLAGCLHLDSKQRRIGAVAGFLRQKARSSESLPSCSGPAQPAPPPCQEVLVLKDIFERLMTLPGLLEWPILTASLSVAFTGLEAGPSCHLILVAVEVRLDPQKRK